MAVSAKANIQPILDNHMDQSVVLHPIGDSTKIEAATSLLGGKEPIETLNGAKEWIDAKGVTWILPLSREFPKFINKHFGKAEYMPTKETFLDEIIRVLEAIKSGKNVEAPLFPYQKFVRDYLKFGTPNRGLLLEHGLGSGKTRSTIEVAKTFRKAGLKTLILTPAFLHLNFMDELKKWEDPGVNINAWYKFAHYNATGYSPGKKSNGLDIGGKSGVFEQLARLGIGFRHDDPDFGEVLFPYLYRAYGRNLQPPEHMLIIIEEAHNLIRNFISEKSKITKYLYALLMKATDCKVICLTGTPMVSNPYEMAPLYNILRGPLADGSTVFPSSENEFNRLYVNYPDRTFTHTDNMMARMVGFGSYFKGITDDENRVVFPARIDHPVNSDVKIIFLEATAYQTWMHDLELYEELLKDKKEQRKEKLLVLPGAGPAQGTMSAAQKELMPSGAYHTRSRASCNFVFPKHIVRPREKVIDWEALEKYVFTFQMTSNGDGPKTVDDFKEILLAIRIGYDISADPDDDDDEGGRDPVSIANPGGLDDQYWDAEVIKGLEPFNKLINDRGKYPKTWNKRMRKYLSEIILNKELLTKSHGLPVSEQFAKLSEYLTDSDHQMITRCVGKYKDRIRIALERLTEPVNGTSPLMLNALKHYGVKMYKIYMTITSDTDAGAPHVIDADQDQDQEQDQEEEIIQSQEYEIAGDPEEDQAEQEEQEADDDEDVVQELDSEEITDPLDPLGNGLEGKKHLRDVYQPKSWFKQHGKRVRGGPAVVYSYFSSAEGAAIFSMVLKAHGFVNFTSTTDKPENMTYAKRFAFFRGGMDAEVKRNILRVFNSKENVNGQLIRVIFVTQAAAEGINLYNVRQIHIMEPHWDNVMIEQVIGRGFRLMAHRYIDDPDDREINVFRYHCVRRNEIAMNEWWHKQGHAGNYYAQFGELIRAGTDTQRGPMADQIIQSIADEKDKFRMKLNDIRVKVAVDCYLNNQYNKPTDGCFDYYSTTGDALSETQGKVVTKSKSVKIRTITIKKGGVKKYYILYPDRKPVNLRFKGKSGKVRAMELYGPVDKEPTADQPLPKTLELAGYLDELNRKFIGLSDDYELSST